SRDRVPRLRRRLSGRIRSAGDRRRWASGGAVGGLCRLRGMGARVRGPSGSLQTPLRGGLMTDVPYRVDKPWGYELIWARTERYVGKILHVKAGHILSLQYHNFKDETMHVLRGELILRTKDGETLAARAFRAGGTGRIPPKLLHPH